MLHWAQPCKKTKLNSQASRIPVTQAKRNRTFRMSDKKQPNTTSNDHSSKSTRSADGTSRELGITESKNGYVSSKYERHGVQPPKRNIETEVFDWLSKSSETWDKYTNSEYCLATRANVCISTGDLHRTTNGKTVSKHDEENDLELTESEPKMAKRANSVDTGTKSYFNAFKNAFFPFEGKYFYLSGELNSQKVPTETTKIIGDNSGHLVDKTNCSDDRYKEILGDRRGEIETKQANKKWENSGLKDTKVYHEDQRMHLEDKNGYAKYKNGYNKTFDNMTPMKLTVKSDDFSENEINRLRAQIEKLSTFVESSDERREQAEILLAQQKEELQKQIREKEVLDNRVCCLDEVRRNLQRKVAEISEENMSLQIALKSSEEKLIDEEEKVQKLKKECSTEIAKNVELELVLQTIREELGCPTSKSHNASDSSLGTRKSDLGRDWNESRVEKKVTWGNITVQSQEVENIERPQSPASNSEPQHRSLNTRIPKPKRRSPGNEDKPEIQYSCLKQHTSEEAVWKREKKQFEGKILLLEMDKRKLRSQIELFEAKIIKQENAGNILRENNEVLEFRIHELECELMEKTKVKV